MKTNKHKSFRRDPKTDVFFRRKLGADQKKKVFAKIEVLFCRKLGVDQKKKAFAKIEVLFRRKLGEDHKKKGLCRNLKHFFFRITIPAEFGAIFDRTL